MDEMKQTVRIRLMTKEDTDLIVSWRNNRRVISNFIYRGEFTREVHENWIRTQIDTGKVVQFIVEETETGRPIGSVYLRDINRDHGRAEFGIFIGEDDAVGRGYGSEATRQILDYAFETLGLHKVFLRVLEENKIARRVYEKIGFKEEGHFRDEVFLDGEYKDVIFMAVIHE